MTIIYTDNNATTQVDAQVVKEMLPCFTANYGNPSSMHALGADAGHVLKLARQRVATLLNVSSEEIMFTSCGTESDSTAIMAALQANPEKKHIVTTTVEHSAVKNLCESLKKNEGYRVTFVPVDKRGRLDLKTLFGSLSEDTAIVSVMWANNETGTVFPVQEIAKTVASKGITFHTDAVQAVGKLPIDLSDSSIHMLSLSGHKIHAPKGVGALYIKKGTQFAPFMVGGHQEKGRRAGTENVTSIVGLGKACELCLEHMDDLNTRVKVLRDRLENELVSRIPKSFVNGDVESRLPNTTSISFEYVEGEAILLMMNEYGICASSGSACTSGSLEPSHVLRAMGVPFTAAHGTIRFSLSVYNTEDDVDYIIDKLPAIIERLRAMSPFWEESVIGNNKA